MKIIELLNKIANGEEVPKKIRFNNIEWNKVYGEKNVYYINEYDSDFFLYFFRKNLDFTLNDEVEIIEEEKEIEKKIEKIIISMDDDSMPYVTNDKYQKLSYSDVDLLFASRINELIDVVEYKEYQKLEQQNKELHNKIDKVIELNNQIIKDTKSFYRPTSDTIYSGDCLMDIAGQNLKILKGSDVDE